MERGLFDFGYRDADVLLQCAGRSVLRPPENAVEVSLGPVRRVLPATARGKEDTFTEPSPGHGRAGGGDDPDAVGEERDVVEGDTRVEVLANEMVAVVQGGGEEFNRYFGGLGGLLRDIDELESGELACQQLRQRKHRK